MMSMSQLMINESKARQMTDTDIIGSYQRRMADLDATKKPTNLKAQMREIELHRCQSPCLVPKTRNEATKKKVPANDKAHSEGSKQSLASDSLQVVGATDKGVLCEVGTRKSSDSDEWKSQVVDDSFDHYLDAEIERSTAGTPEDGRVTTPGITPSKTSNKNREPGASPESSDRTVRRNLEFQSDIDSAKEVETPSREGKSDSAITGSLTSDIQSTETCQSAPQRLRELGLPERAPKTCEVSGIFNKWMEGGSTMDELSSAEQTGTALVKGDECRLPPDNKSDTGSSGSIKKADVSFDDKFMECDMSERKPKEYKQQEIVVPDDSCVMFLMAFIESPSKFWIHIVSKEAQEALDDLKRELNEHYAKTNTVMLKKYFQGREMHLNTLCCAQYNADDSFYRAVIIGLCHTIKETMTGTNQKEDRSGKQPESERKISEVKVMYVDFGDTEWVPVNRVYPLPPRLVIYIYIYSSYLILLYIYYYIILQKKIIIKKKKLLLMYNILSRLCTIHPNLQYYVYIYMYMYIFGGNQRNAECVAGILY